jgi:flavin reductase (DIM6/NTAB) family NADH-FMN oxidoreductase RutF
VKETDSEAVEAANRAAICASLAAIPSGRWVLTAAHEERRMGMMVTWMQQVCFSPPTISLSIAKGSAIMPLLSESRRFALCQLGSGDKTIRRKFSREPSAADDPFLGASLAESLQGKLPILQTSVGFLECELVCHLDVEGDHDLFVGRVTAGGRFAAEGEVVIREDGFAY